MMNIHETLKYQNIGLPDDILRRKLHGDFSGVLRLIDRRLNEETLPQPMRCCLIAQREMIRRLPGEFPYDRSQALALIREHIPDFTEEEFDELVDGRQIRWIYNQGEMRFFERFYDSLQVSVPGFAQRVLANVHPPVSEPSRVNLLDKAILEMKQQGSLSNRIRIRASVRINDACFRPGMFVRVHIPIPSACLQQRDIRIESVFPNNGQPAPENALQRTVCWEANMEENREFSVEYSYIHTAVYHDVYNGVGQPCTLADYLREEAPHIVFTPYIRHLAQSLTQGIRDPLHKARAFYDFITRNMHYTYMPSYFLLENIADTCARDQTGDCGVFALLFITLCRCAGIPAQWQSGLAAGPESAGCHDWAAFYIEPYGWLFADPSFGVSAHRSGKEDRRQFYFGNLDPYRMVANSAFQAPFTVEKKHWRADPYDNQSGEIETEERGLRSEEYSWDSKLLSVERL